MVTRLRTAVALGALVALSVVLAITSTTTASAQSNDQVGLIDVSATFNGPSLAGDVEIRISSEQCEDIGPIEPDTITDGRVRATIEVEPLAAAGVLCDYEVNLTADGWEIEPMPVDFGSFDPAAADYRDWVELSPRWIVVNHGIDDAKVIEPASPTVASSTRGSRLQRNEPTCDDAYAEASTWFRYTAPTSEPLVVRTLELNFGRTEVSVFTSDSAQPTFADLNLVDCAGESLVIEAEASTTYWIQVTQSGGSDSPYFVLQVTPIDEGGSVRFSVADKAGPYAMKVADLPASWRIEMQPITDGCVGELRVEELAPRSEGFLNRYASAVEYTIEDVALYNTDLEPCSYELMGQSVDGFHLYSENTTATPAIDEVEWIFDRERPEFVYTQRPLHDAVANALQLTELDGSGFLTYATVEAGESTCLSADAEIPQTVWASFVAPETGFVRFIGSGVVESLGLFDGSTDAPVVADLELVRCGYSVASSSYYDDVQAIEAAVTEGERYWLQLASTQPEDRPKDRDHSFFVEGQMLDNNVVLPVTVRASGGDFPAQWAFTITSSNCSGFEAAQTIDFADGNDSIDVALQRLAPDGALCEYDLDFADDDGWAAPATQSVRFEALHPRDEDAIEAAIDVSYRKTRSNDDYLNAEPLVGSLPINVTVDLSGATLQPDERDCFWFPENDDAIVSRWYRFTAPADDAYRFTNSSVLVYNASSEDPSNVDLRLCAQRETLAATAGQHYWLQVLGDPADGPVVFSIEALSADRGTFNVVVTTADEPLPESIEVQVVSPNCDIERTEMITTVTGSDRVSIGDLRIFDAAGESCFWIIDADAGPEWSAQERVAYPAEEPGRDVGLTLLRRPPNDDPAGALPISLPATLEPDVEGATNDTDGCVQTLSAVWFTFTAETDFIVKPSFAYFSGYGIYTSTVASPTAEDLDLVACPDRSVSDTAIRGAAGTTYYVLVAGNSIGPSVRVEPLFDDGEIDVTIEAGPDAIGLPSAISATVISSVCAIERTQAIDTITGTDEVTFGSLPLYNADGEECEYDVATTTPVGWTESRRGVDGPLDFPQSTSIRYTNIADNDRIEHAEVITAERRTTVTIDSQWSLERDEDFCSSSSRWYTWTAPEDGTLELVSVRNHAQSLGVATGFVSDPQSADDLNRIACDRFNGQLAFPVVGGETYWISAQADFDVTVDVSFIPTRCGSLSMAPSDGRLSGSFTINDRGLAATPNAPSEARHYQFDAASDDHIEFCVDVTRGGDYYLFAEMLSADLGSDSFWVVIDGGEAMPVYAPPSNSPVGTYVRDLEGNPRSFTLTDGAHDIRFVQRETGAQLAAAELRLVRTTSVPLDTSCDYDGYNRIDFDDGEEVPPYEAERAITRGSIVKWADGQVAAEAAGTGYIGVSPYLPNQFVLDEDDAALFCFTRYRGGGPNRFTLSARVLAPDNSADSLWVRIGNDDPFIWHLDEALEWSEQTAHVVGTSDPYEFGWAGGDLKIRLYARDSGTMIDWIRLNPVYADYVSYPSQPAG